MQQKLTTKRFIILLLLLVGLGYFLGSYKDFKKGFKEGYNHNSVNTKELKENNLYNPQQMMLINTFSL